MQKHTNIFQKPSPEKKARQTSDGRDRSRRLNQEQADDEADDSTFSYWLDTTGKAHNFQKNVKDYI